MENLIIIKVLFFKNTKASEINFYYTDEKEVTMSNIVEEIRIDTQLDKKLMRTKAKLFSKRKLITNKEFRKTIFNLPKIKDLTITFEKEDTNSINLINKLKNQFKGIISKNTIVTFNL